MYKEFIREKNIEILKRFLYRRRFSFLPLSPLGAFSHKFPGPPTERETRPGWGVYEEGTLSTPPHHSSHVHTISSTQIPFPLPPSRPSRKTGRKSGSKKYSPRPPSFNAPPPLSVRALPRCPLPPSVRTLKAPLPFLHSAPTVGYPFTHAILISYFAPPPTFPGVGRRGAGNVSSISPPSQQPIYPGRFSFPPTTDLRPGLGRDGPSPGGGSRLPLRTGASLYATIGEYDFLLPALRFMATEAEGDFPPRRQIKAFSLRATTNMYCSKSRRVRSELFVKKAQIFFITAYCFMFCAISIREE